MKPRVLIHPSLISLLLRHHLVCLLLTCGSKSNERSLRWSGLKHRMCTGGLKKLGVFNLEKRHFCIFASFCEDLTAVYTKVTRGYRQEREGCVLEVRGGGLRGKEHKSEHGKFQCCEIPVLCKKLLSAFYDES